MKPKTTCRVCGSKQIELALSLGSTPLANSYPTTEELLNPVEYYPLDLYQCKVCDNVQLGCVVDPKKLFNTYLYTSSTSPVFVKHFVDFAEEYVKAFKPTQVLDIGSNDGILLKPFKDLGVTVLGVEPAKNIESSVPTLNEFFTEVLAKKILKEFGRFDLVTATNVFAHIDDLDEIVSGVKMVLSDNGQFVIEVTDMDQMLKHGTFDLIYHEHVNYWSEKTIKRFFDLREMVVTKIDRVPVHGGSLRIYARLSE